jgi:hypothetical protein
MLGGETDPVPGAPIEGRCGYDARMDLRSRQRWVRWVVLALALIVAISMALSAVAFLPFG